MSDAGPAGGGVWRSLVARPLWERKAAGSNPATPTQGRSFPAMPGAQDAAPLASPAQLSTGAPRGELLSGQGRPMPAPARRRVSRAQRAAAGAGLANVHRRHEVGPTPGAALRRCTPGWATIRAAQWASTERTAALIVCLVVSTWRSPGRTSVWSSRSTVGTTPWRSTRSTTHFGERGHLDQRHGAAGTRARPASHPDPFMAQVVMAHAVLSGRLAAWRCPSAMPGARHPAPSAALGASQTGSGRRVQVSSVTVRPARTPLASNPSSGRQGGRSPSTTPHRPWAASWARA